MSRSHGKVAAMWTATVVLVALAATPILADEAAAPSAAPVDIRGIWKDTTLDENGAAARGLTASDIVTPRKVKHVNPTYADLAKERGIQGKVSLECTIDISGVPTDCIVTRGRHPLLDKAALECVKGWRFTPLTVRGVPAPALVEFSVTFKLG